MRPARPAVPVSSTHDRILRASMRLYADRGGTEVDLKQIAAEAGVARGTLYRYLGSVDGLLPAVIGALARSLQEQIDGHVDRIAGDDPVARTATGLRLIVRAAHDDPDLGRFVVRFGLSEAALREVVAGPAVAEVERGVAAGVLTLPPGGRPAVLALLVGTATSHMWLVLDGRLGWREAGTAAAWTVLRALGVADDEARRWATEELA
jgi:AcrR family transcriptional regulator